MNCKIKFLPLLAALALLAGGRGATAQGTAFTYQGRLISGGSPANGSYDLTFALYTTNAAGTAVAGPVTNNAVTVTNGLFTVQIDFGGSVFVGSTNWLQIEVATNGVTTFTPLTPRQPLTPVPQAVFAESAGALSAPLSASQLNSIGNTNGGAYENFFIGLAGNATTTGHQNTAVGQGALYNNTSGSGNTASGDAALSYNFTGADNTASGCYALLFNTTGTFNLANGYEALFSNRTGSANVANGYQALLSNVAGNNNVADGVNALYASANGSENTAVGYGALQQSTGDSDLVAVGTRALENDAAYNLNNPGDGNGHNTALGYQALQFNNTGIANSASGYEALNQNTTGTENTANGALALNVNTSGIQNTADGAYSLLSMTAGSYNVADGFSALGSATNGNGNIAIGILAGYELLNGSNNIYIGNTGISHAESGNIYIGNQSATHAAYISGQVCFGSATPEQQLNLTGGAVFDQGNQNNGTVANTLRFGSGSGEGIGSTRVSGQTDTDGLDFYTGFGKRLTILNSGQVGIDNTNPSQLFVVGSGGAYCNGATWVNGSDRNTKRKFDAVNPGEVLAKVSALPITEWQYKVEADGTRHIGPMAQDFHAAFGLNGADDKHISTVDEGGVALAAIQGLNEKLNEKDAEIADLKARLQKLEYLMTEKLGGAK